MLAPSFVSPESHREQHRAVRPYTSTAGEVRYRARMGSSLRRLHRGKTIDTRPATVCARRWQRGASKVLGPTWHERRWFGVTPRKYGYGSVTTDGHRLRRSASRRGRPRRGQLGGAQVTPDGLAVRRR